MKNVVAILLASIVLVAGCSQTVDQSQIVKRHRTLYRVNSEEPFSGVVEQNDLNGQLSKRYEVDNGKLNGSFQSWYSSGQNKVQGGFKDSVMTGVWVYWYSNGQEDMVFNVPENEYTELKFTSYFSDGVEKGENDRVLFRNPHTEETIELRARDAAILWAPTTRITGLVTYDGEQLEDATISLIPNRTSVNSFYYRRRPSGVSNIKGEFSLQDVMPLGNDSEGAVAGTYTVRVSAYPSGEGYDQMVARMTDDSSTALDNRILGMFSTYEIIDGWDNQISVPSPSTETQRTLIINLQSNGKGKAILSGEFQGDCPE